MRKTINVVLCLTAVASIGWSGTLLWQTWRNRQEINEACAGLVPAGRVLALSPAGGTVSHRVADEGTLELDAGLPQDCEIFSTEAGEKYGTSTGERWFFTGAVGILPSEEPPTPEDPIDQLVDPYGGPTYPPEPLGGGVSGVVTASGVTVELPCPKGKSNGKRVKALWARASLADPRPPFTEKGQLSAHDRSTLADIAVRTGNNLAERLGCADRLPEAPEAVPALSAGPSASAEAHGTCAWYRKAGFPKDKRLPDQVLESRTDDRMTDERCGLVLGDVRARRLWSSGAADHDSADRPSRPGQWFVSLHTYSGEDAKNIRLEGTDSTKPPVVAAPGTAGRVEEPVWWASSVCVGKPQIHTMTVANDYDELITPQRAKRVFRAYVSDIVARRGCTGTKFPDASAFASERTARTAPGA